MDEIDRKHQQLNNFASNPSSCLPFRVRQKKSNVSDNTPLYEKDIVLSDWTNEHPPFTMDEFRTVLTNMCGMKNDSPIFYISEVGKEVPIDTDSAFLAAWRLARIFRDLNEETQKMIILIDCTTLSDKQSVVVLNPNDRVPDRYRAEVARENNGNQAQEEQGDPDDMDPATTDVAARIREVQEKFDKLMRDLDFNNRTRKLRPEDMPPGWFRQLMEMA